MLAGAFRSFDWQLTDESVSRLARRDDGGHQVCFGAYGYAVATIKFEADQVGNGDKFLIFTWRCYRRRDLRRFGFDAADCQEHLLPIFNRISLASILAFAAVPFAGMCCKTPFGLRVRATGEKSGGGGRRGGRQSPSLHCGCFVYGGGWRRVFVNRAKFALYPKYDGGTLGYRAGGVNPGKWRPWQTLLAAICFFGLMGSLDDSNYRASINCRR